MVPQSTTDSAAELGRWLLTRGWTVATAESCTGGGMGYAITTVPGSGQWFAGGFITYMDEVKQKVLGVPGNTIVTHGAVSCETAEAMAKQALKQVDADIAIAVTGIAGPTGGSKEKPVGLVWFGLAWAGQCISWEQRFSGDREAVRIAAIEHALGSFKKIP
ncbi:CinA family protein [Pseudidiomarina sp.]|uniref:CinA family protein n=1 Tax=Pseudidiomarina sp. TaxID=2081707 RepID=UPI00299ED773|nr:CinA family protein [Pseudidiomarina sp.]MDX1704917.1 CinA family protein [Pseudidiomarina sp.]